MVAVITRNVKIRELIVFGVFALVFAGCNLFDKPTIPQEKFVPYYIDMIAMQDSLGTDTQSSKKIIQALNKKYSVTEEQVQNTLQEMNTEPKMWEKFFEKVNEELALRVKKATPAPVVTAPADTSHTVVPPPPAAGHASH